jgi:cyanophycinase-like exopeptidase
VLVEADGHATVVGNGSAYFVDGGNAFGMMVGGKFGVMALHRPLTFGPFDVEKVSPGHVFDLKTWAGDATRYSLYVRDGVIEPTQAGEGVY